MPFGATISPPSNVRGSSRCRPASGNENYTVSYDSAFGGHWELTGRRHIEKDGTYTDSFRGTVSDTSIQATLTRNDLDWLSDWSWLCPHEYRQCSSFSITISDGSVTGFANYMPLSFSSTKSQLPSDW
jgi:hypothetical protein